MTELERAYEKALGFLERRERTEHEVRGRLSKAGFSEGVCEGTIMRLREVGLVDDEGYAARYLEVQKAKGRGRIRIAEELRRKGLDSGLVGFAVEDGCDFAGERERAFAAARGVLGVDVGARGDGVRKVYAKINRRLVSLGFGYDVIGSVMEEIRREGIVGREGLEDVSEFG